MKREKAGGRYATGLLVQLPAPGAGSAAIPYRKLDATWLTKS
jgi:hypothetical protein